MKHVKLVALCLGAAFAIAAIAATTASAKEPEWGQCYKKAGGKYTNGSCTAKGKGEYEWKKNTEVRKFTGAGGAGALAAVLRACENKKNEEKRTGDCPAEGGYVESFGATIECTGESATGEAYGSDLVKNVKVTFKGCIALGVLPCKTEGASAEEVKVNTLKGKLGYIDKATHEAGVSLEPETKGGDFAEVLCEGLNFVVGQAKTKEASNFYSKKKEKTIPFYAPKGGGDTIISPITNLDEMTNTFTQHYTVNEQDENIPSKFEGGKIDVLETYFVNPEGFEGEWSPAGEQVTNVDTVEGEPVEIKG